ncbi:MAG: FAD-dependent monooxygenase, partial [Vicinamibacterales bacterium]
MRIAINGTGVAGPTLAYWLRRFGHTPMLFEKAPALRAGGYVIDFWGLGYEIAERMGLVPALVDRGYLMQRLRLVDANGREIAGMDVAPLREQVEGRFISIARADLAAALFRACEGIPAHFGVSIIDLRQDARGVNVTLSDGRMERFDLVIGADGLHSRVRELVFGPEDRFERPLGCHVAAFRLTDYPHRDPLIYVSHTVPKRQVARVALRDGETLILLICRSELIDGVPPRELQKGALREVFGQMAWEVPDILARMDAVDDLYFDRISQIHLKRWTLGRIALLGDAAACASLLAGEGTGLAMIEAYVLAGEL